MLGEKEGISKKRCSREAEVEGVEGEEGMQEGVGVV